jgi:hypothetical protein
MFACQAALVVKVFFMSDEILVNLQLRSALFWGIAHRRVVILYRRFGANYRYQLKWARSPRLFLSFLTLEYGTDTLSRNVGKGLPIYAALYPRRAQISSASRRKPEITET